MFFQTKNEGFTDIASTNLLLQKDNAVKQLSTNVDPLSTNVDWLLNFLRSKPNSCSTFIGEQPNPWDLLQPQDVKSRHRGAKRSRRYELLGIISLLSPAYL